MGATQSTDKPIVHTTSKGRLKGIQRIENVTQKPAYYRFTRVPYARHLLVIGASTRIVYTFNIWVPAQRPPPYGWPVQFYIHGGWLQVGNDQRAALEWTYANITEFGGNPKNISLGGLSTGAYSSIFRLNYDVRLPNKADRLIKRVYLHSNAVGVQPNDVSSPALEAPVDELLTECGIPTGLSPQGKVDALRQIPSETLIQAVHRMKRHTFRAGTDGDFVNASFLADINSGEFGKLLANQGVDIMLGEVADEATLYRMVNPASDYDSLVVQLSNYYPEKVTKALLQYYTLPTTVADKDEWADIGSIIIGDCQVHATIRGFTASLLKTMPEERVLRYRISWRAKALDNWLQPSIGMCHASDIPIWWACGRRAGYEQADLDLVSEWLNTFYQYLCGDKPAWGATGLNMIKELKAEGKVEDMEDANLDKGLEVWNVMIKAQLDLP
ncbi:hypothetical protein NW756_014030 [Fusarium oxysporum]|nr:hypothetical protein NW763_014307 [Fusarium oxysporum]KAJ4034495.1 hypothetical protein NW753_012377 [Fusarium oxysporum]KAJ4073939.1 hypothetical protein NW756_014030 [Fusarium oxysporum]